MGNKSLPRQFWVLFSIRMALQTGFLVSLILNGGAFEIFLLFLVAIIAAEGYKLLGGLGIFTAPQNRDLIGLVTGVLNGVIYMITIYLTGYVNTEIWVFVFVSLAITGYEFGLMGVVAESIVMSAMYVLVGSLEEIPIATLIIRATVFMLAGAIFGEKSTSEIILGKRFLELEKRKSLTKEERVRFVAVVSHSLRTPITAITGYIDLLQKGRIGKLSKEQKEIIDKLANETREMGGLIEDFVSVASFEQRGVDVELAEFNICRLCEEIYNETKSQAEHKELKYTFDSKAKTCRYMGDRSKLENAVKNVLDNAFKFTPPGGQIDFVLMQDRDNFFIEVTDTGIGIPKKDQGDIFSMFKRATNVLKYEYKGIGLGLYMSRMIVEALGGRIELESEEGRGSKFQIVLPAGKFADVVRKLS